MKTILVPAANDDDLTLRLETALSVARTTGGHVRCVHATPTSAYVSVEPFGGVYVMPEIMAAISEGEAKVREAVERELDTEDVSWDYLQMNGDQPEVIAACATLSDLIVVSRSGSGKNALSRRNIGHLLMGLQTPLLVPTGTGPAYDPLAPAIIAWNGSRESANAVRGAIPLLQKASEVKVVEVRKKASALPFPGTGMLEYLSRHGIHAELREELRGDRPVAELLLDQVDRCEARLLVMGGYGHWRATEYLFGGVTRTLIDDAPVALLLAH